MKSVLRLKVLTALAAIVSMASIAAVPIVPRHSMPVWHYTVRPGDTLINIAARYLARVEYWPVVQSVNRIDDPARLMPGTLLRISAALLRRAPAEVLLETCSGDVRWRRSGEDWQVADRGQHLPVGSTIETREGASALLRLADGSTLQLSAHSQVIFDTLGAFAGGLMADTRLRLQQGNVDVLANPAKRIDRQLRIQTPSAQAVVRGTRFRLGVEGNTTRQETLSGRVAVIAAGRSVSVPVGRGTVIRAGEPPMAPARLLRAPDMSTIPGRFEHLPLRFPMPDLAGAQAWQGDIAEDPSFDPVLLGKRSDGVAMTFPDLPNGEYFLRLRAVSASGLQGMDGVRRFVVFARPFPPALIWPGNAATIREARPTLTWSPIEGVAAYRLQIGVDGDFSPPLHELTTDGSAWQLPEDLPAGQLFWRGNGIDEAGRHGPWSSPVAFTFKPGPGPVDPGKLGIDLSASVVRLNLPDPPEGLLYDALVSSGAGLAPIIAQAQSTSGELELPHPGGGTYYLGVRLVDNSDSTQGPWAVRRFDVPYRPWWLLLLLLPLAF